MSKSPSSSLTARGLSKGAKAGIGIGVATAVLLLYMFGMFCFFWMFRRREEESAEIQQAIANPKENPELFSD